MVPGNAVPQGLLAAAQAAAAVLDGTAIELPIGARLKKKSKKDKAGGGGGGGGGGGSSSALAAAAAAGAADASGEFTLLPPINLPPLSLAHGGSGDGVEPIEGVPPMDVFRALLTASCPPTPRGGAGGGAK